MNDLWDIGPNTAKGNAKLLDDGVKRIAVVGARDCTNDHLRTATEFGSLLADEGITLVSGDARGIDDAAQQGALRKGGNAVMVLPYGIFKWKARKTYADDVDFEKGNLLVYSQFEPGQRWHVSNAFTRNRRIVEMADAVVAFAPKAESGGTKSTCEYTLQAGKPLFVFDPVFREEEESKGIERLLAMNPGAVPFFTAAELVQLLDVYVYE